jgi:cell division protein FtsN
LSQQSANEQGMDLASLTYSASFPAVKIALGDSKQPEQAVNPEDGADESLPAAVDSTVDQTGQVAASAGQIAPQAPDQAEANAAKLTEQKKLDVAEEKKKLDERKKEEKKKAAEAEKKKTEAKAKEESKDQKDAGTGSKPKTDAATTKSSGFEYKVYAGGAPSREAAEQIKNEVVASGVSGTVIKSGGDYLVLVATLEDYDSAMALKSKLASSGFSGAFATRKSK